MPLLSLGDALARLQLGSRPTARLRFESWLPVLPTMTQEAPKPGPRAPRCAAWNRCSAVQRPAGCPACLQAYGSWQVNLGIQHVQTWLAGFLRFSIASMLSYPGRSFCEYKSPPSQLGGQALCDLARKLFAFLPGKRQKRKGFGDASGVGFDFDHRLWMEVPPRMQMRSRPSGSCSASWATAARQRSDIDVGGAGRGWGVGVRQSQANLV